MKVIDILKLSKYEYKYNKKECIYSGLVHIVILVCMLVSLTFSIDISKISNDYISPKYNGEFSFKLRGFCEEDTDWLEKRGFSNLIYDEDGNIFMADCTSIVHIWKYKLQAVFAHKDIWSEELDSYLEIVLYGRVIFFTITVIMFIMYVNSLLNSINMKNEERKRYKLMLSNIGAQKKDCIKIFLFYFITKNCIEYFAVIAINFLIINAMNNIINKKLNISTVIDSFKPGIILFTFLLSIMIISVSIVRIWRKSNDI